jgi:pimeloyl-ACP methyl ester carboxylesterase
MPQLPCNGITLDYDSFGPTDAPAILLIMGLGAQKGRWNQELCDALVALGYRVIRYDNRDSGGSSRCDNTGLPDLSALLRGEPLNALPYTLEDMADDAIGLLDALAIARAHVAGASLGGAVAQIAAARHPQRVLSLTSIMSSSGNPMLPPPTPAAAQALFAPMPLLQDEASIVADALRRYRVIASPAYPTESARLERMFAEEYRRCFNPTGVARQLAAILANGDRRPLLRQLRLPTVVVHGAADPLIPPECGRDVAASIPGAEYREIPGMGHDFPVQLTGVLADAIASAVRRGEAASH